MRLAALAGLGVGGWGLGNALAAPVGLGGGECARFGRGGNGGAGGEAAIERGTHFLFGATEGGRGGHRPGEGVGAAAGDAVHLGQAAEGGADGVAEGGEDAGASLREKELEMGLGAAVGGGKWGEIETKGAGGEVAGAGEAVGDGEDGGTLAILEDGRGGAGRDFAEGEAGAGGQAAEGVGKGGGEGGDVIEGEDPVVLREGGKFARGRGGWGEQGGTGVDQPAKDAGGHGLAGSGRAPEDEGREGAKGAEGRQEPGEATEPVGAGGQVEDRAEFLEGGGRAGGTGLRGGERVGEAGGFDVDIGGGGGAPAGGGDFDELAIGIGKVEEDLVREGVLAARADAAEDDEAAVPGVGVGLGFEVEEERVEGAIGREGGVIARVGGPEPLAVFAGTEGEDVEAARVGTELGEGAALFVGEVAEGAFGDSEERGERDRFGHSDSGLARRRAGFGHEGREVVEGWRKKFSRRA